jgi:hypothetical protein
VQPARGVVASRSRRAARQAAAAAAARRVLNQQQAGRTQLQRRPQRTVLAAKRVQCASARRKQRISLNSQTRNRCCEGITA